MSEQAPERAGQRPPPGKKENVLTRKLGPLPTWVWIAIAALVILLYVVFVGNKNKASTTAGQGQATGPFGAFLQPLVIFRRRGRGGGGGGGKGGGGGEDHDNDRPPHTRHHHRRGDHDDQSLRDLDIKVGTNRMARDPRRGDGGGGRDTITDATVGIDRRVKRGEEIPGFLVGFKTAERGQTPSLLDVANHYETSPDAIVAEAAGRGAPSSVAWKRYVARHDWNSPLPPATDLSILAHPS